ncbi:MAG: hypothetical protein PHV52_00040 [Aliarcobacter sp.]|nr:hypothetical protein [Aliarcobacter sp.]
MFLSIEEKEKQLNGKRYKVISMAIQKRTQKGEVVSHEMEIDLHYCWMITMKDIKQSIGDKKND